jgi:hypothetical protein
MSSSSRRLSRTVPHSIRGWKSSGNPYDPCRRHYTSGRKANVDGRAHTRDGTRVATTKRVYPGLEVN